MRMFSFFCIHPFFKHYNRFHFRKTNVLEKLWNIYSFQLHVTSSRFKNLKLRSIRASRWHEVHSLALTSNNFPVYRLTLITSDVNFAIPIKLAKCIELQGEFSRPIRPDPASLYFHNKEYFSPVARKIIPSVAFAGALIRNFLSHPPHSLRILLNFPPVQIFIYMFEETLLSR